MSADAGVSGRLREAAKRRLEGSLPEDLAAELIRNRLAEEPNLQPWFDAMTDADARAHFGADEIVHDEHLLLALRLFHAWRVATIRERIGDQLEQASFLDVGDTDGFILRDLGQQGLGFNLSEAAVENIRSNGIEARLGDAQELPFEDGSFDYVLCFETLEHVENPQQLLDELGRVVRPDGRVFVSIPWVPRTFVHPRKPEIDRGYAHVFEFSRDDFHAVVSHTPPLEVRWEAVCELLGSPTRPAQRAFLAATRGSHLVAGMFRRFQFFELARADAPTR